MENKKTDKDLQGATDSKILKIVSANLKHLLSQKKMTQKDLCILMGVTPATMSEYCNGGRLPSVDFFITLKKHFNINIDEFLTKSVTVTADALPQTSKSDPAAEDIYGRYCGSYIVYYFDTGRYKGYDTQSPKDSVTFGLLCIYGEESVIGVMRYRVAALLGLEAREDAETAREKLGERPAGEEVRKYADSCEEGTFYEGDFELSPEHGFISLKHGHTDRAFVILHRVEIDKGDYIGGIGTVNSVSKGRERAPVVQFMGLSRYPLAMSVEEIHHTLLLGYPGFNAEEETEEMIRNFKALYVDPNETANEFSEYQKSVIVRSMLERYIKKSLQRNVFRYGKVSVNDDDNWYHVIKGVSEGLKKQ